MASLDDRGTGLLQVWGSGRLAIQYPGDLAGIHLNATFLRPAPDEQIKEHERAWMRASAAYRATEGDYAGEHGNKPETVAFALADNPVGTAAWIVENITKLVVEGHPPNILRRTGDSLDLFGRAPARRSRNQTS